jgi:WD40 repeat protein
MKRILVLLTMASLLLAACSASPTPGMEATTRIVTVTPQTARPTGTAVPTSLPTSTVTPTNVPTPTLPPAPVSASSLGEPIYLGRGQIADAAFTPDAASVAVGWTNGVSLWDVTSALERWWQPTGVPVIAIDVHPRGEAVAAALADGSILVLDAASGSVQRHEGARPHAYWGDVAWSPDEHTIAFQFIGPRRGDPIYLLDVADGSLGEVPGSRVDEGTPPFLAWSPEGRTITLASLGDRCSEIVDAQTGETVIALQVEGFCASPYYLAWSPDGSRIAVADAFIDPRSGKTIGKLEGGGNWFVLGQPGWPIRFSPDGAYVAAGGQVALRYDLPPIVVWDARTGEKVAQIGEEGDVYDPRRNKARVALAFDGQSLLVLYEDGEIARWAFGSGSPEKAVVGRFPVITAQPPLSWSADGHRFAAGNRYGGAAVWDVVTGHLLTTFDAPLDAPVLSPDGRLLVLTDREQNKRVILGLDTGEVVATLPGAVSLPMGVAFSPDGAQIAYGSGNRVLVADVASGEPIAALAGHPEGQLISRSIWSPDGDALVTASGEPGNSDALAPLILWQRAGDGSFVEVFRTETIRAGWGCCVSLALFNSAGDLVALEALPSAQASDFQVIVYDLKAGKVILTLVEYKLAAWISGEVLLAAEAQYWTRLTRWDVRTGESTIVGGREMGDNVYAPGGQAYARPNMQSPYAMRGIEVYVRRRGRVVDRDIYDGDVLRILWSPDGRWVGALASNGVIVVWPFL